MQSNIEVGIDVGGSGTKIAVRLQNSERFSPIEIFQNSKLYEDKKKCGERVAQSILSTAKKYFPGSGISLVAISMSGNINHQKNIIQLSYALQNCEWTGNKYGEFDLAEAIAKELQKTIQKKIPVILLHDRIAASIDPIYKDRLVLTFTLGTYPVLGLSQKSSQNSTKIYDNYIGNWVDNIEISSDRNTMRVAKTTNITKSLQFSKMKNRQAKQNCQLINLAIIKILQKYKEIFQFQPNCMVIMGGWANVLKNEEEKSIQKIGQVKIIRIFDRTQSVHSQMRGAIEYAKNRKKYIFI